MNGTANLEKLTFHDRQAHNRTRWENRLRIGWLGMKHNPFHMLGELNRYPWLKKLLRANDILDMMTRSRSGLYRSANAVAVGSVVGSIVDMVDGLYSAPERTVLHEDLVPPEILYGMGLNPWMAEFLGIVLPFIDTAIVEGYIDAAEQNGIPPDVCSLPKSTIGLTLKNEMPPPVAIVSSNMPCDGGMTSYEIMQRELNVPAFRLDIPHNFYSERAVEYFVGELKRLIAWLQENTPGRMDWDRLREVCEERNRFVELELELWDLVCRKPAPMAAEPIYLTHLLYGIAMPGRPRGTAAMREIVEITQRIAQSGASAVPDERYRTILWNPPTMMFPELFTWAEQRYGVSMVMDMLTYNRHPLIDTSTPESMLRGLARVVMEGPMARHTRGPAENFFGDLWRIVEQFSGDMIWMAGHIGCKNTQALLGMFREKCRRRGIPLLIINYDLSDTRIVPPAGIRKQVDEFMTTVMNAQPLDAPNPPREAE